MKKYCVTAFVGFLFFVLPQVSFSDSIQVGDTTYDSVYIKKTASHYNIHIPEEGKVVSVSNKRMDVKVLEISDDEERDSLWQAYQDKTQPDNEHPETKDESISTDTQLNQRKSDHNDDNDKNVPQISAKGNMTQSIPRSYGRMGPNAESTSKSLPNNSLNNTGVVNNNAYIPQRPSLNDFSRSMNQYHNPGYFSPAQPLGGYGAISETTGRPKTVRVEGYFRKDGTYVRGHYRSAPRR